MAASSSSSTSCHILPNHGRGKQAVHGWGSKFESLLDKKVIAVIPSPGKMTVLTTWRCAVLDESKDKDVVYARGNGLITRVMVNSPYRLII